MIAKSVDKFIFPYETESLCKKVGVTYCGDRPLLFFKQDLFRLRIRQARFEFA
jgi:hypothetical protein